MGSKHLAGMLAVHDEREVRDDLFWGDLDADAEGVGAVAVARDGQDLNAARRLLAAHFRNRTRPVWMFDARAAAIPKVRRPVFTFGHGVDWSPEYEDKLVRDILDGRFVAPTGRAVEMGLNFENVNPREFWPGCSESNLYNRHLFLLPLCARYAETHDAKYADAAIGFTAAWIDQRPFVVVEDADPETYYLTMQPDQEAMSLGFQMMHWIELLYSGITHRMSDELLCRVIRRMWFVMLQYRRFDTDTYTAGNHHLFERGMMPIVFGTMFPEFKSMHNFLQTGPAVARQHLQQAVGADGGSNEHSVAYGASAIGLFDEVDYRARLNGLELFGQADRTKLRKAHMFQCHSLGPDGYGIPFGDGGRKRSADVILAAAVDSGCPEARGVCEALEMPAALFPGVTRQDYDRLPSCLPPKEGIFESTGFLFVRDAWHRRANGMAMAIPRPEAYLHGHQDPLSVLVYLNGTSFLTHHGPEGYRFVGSGNGRKRIERGRFYNMTTQNCLLVHGHPIQSDEALCGGFGHPAPRCTIEDHRATEDGYYVRAWHEGYEFVRHTRETRLLYGGGVLVADKLTLVEGKDPMELRPYRQWGGPFHVQRWHLDYGVEATPIDGGAVHLKSREQDALLVWPAGAVKAMEIYPMWSIPLWRDGEESERPLVVDAHFGPEEEASLRMLIIAVPEGDNADLALKKARELLDRTVPDGNQEPAH